MSKSDHKGCTPLFYACRSVVLHSRVCLLYCLFLRVCNYMDKNHLKSFWLDNSIARAVDQGPDRGRCTFISFLSQLLHLTCMGGVRNHVRNFLSGFLVVFLNLLSQISCYGWIYISNTDTLLSEELDRILIQDLLFLQTWPSRLRKVVTQSWSAVVEDERQGDATGHRCQGVQPSYKNVSVSTWTRAEQWWFVWLF